jgi:formylglycine-generating enzyme required for sulfatase activity
MPLRLVLLPLGAVFLCSLVFAEPTTVKPPKVPRMSNEYIDESQLVALKQPPALAAELAALGEGTVEERVARLKKKVIADLIFVEGGTFMMGDFGPLVSPEGLHYSDDITSRPVHEVQLSSYSIAKYKTTNAEFSVYSVATGTKPASDDGFGTKHRYPEAPVGVPWQRAKDYCKWLGKITQLPFDLPTEAQWEYAARSRGQFFVWATDNGNIDYGRNIPAAGQIEMLTPSHSDEPYPVGLFPPNPLGLYDASHDGEEWVNDWFDAQYYKHSPKKDPQGPATGKMKVARGWPNGDSIMPNTMYRREHPLVFRSMHLGDFGIVSPSYLSQGVRCAVQQKNPVH